MPVDEGRSVWNPTNQVLEQSLWLNKVEPDSIPMHGHHDVLQNRAKMKLFCL